MTKEQKSWLDTNRARGYRVLSRAGGDSRFVKTGILHADGTFEQRIPGVPVRITQGCFEVGVLEQKA